MVQKGVSHPILKSWCEIETTVQVIWFRHLISFRGVTPPSSPIFIMNREREERGVTPHSEIIVRDKPL